jgi:hypothetical protein
MAEKNYDDKTIYTTRATYFDFWSFKVENNDEYRVALAMHDHNDDHDRQYSFSLNEAKSMRDKLLKLLPLNQNEYDPNRDEDI